MRTNRVTLWGTQVTLKTLLSRACRDGSSAKHRRALVPDYGRSADWTRLESKEASASGSSKRWRLSDV